MRKRKANIKKQDHRAFADAVCMGLSELEIAKQFNVSEGTVINYQNYAKGYSVGTPADKKLAELTYYKLGKGVLKEISKNIDAGKYYGLGYKKNQSHTVQYGPHINSNPIKEEAPVMVQQKLQFDSPGCSEKRGPVSKNDVDTHAILMRTLDAIIELCQAVRAVGK